MLTWEVYREQPPRFAAQHPRAWFNKFSQVVLEVGVMQSQVDYSVFVGHNSSNIVIFIVYDDDTLLSSNDVNGIEEIN